jgi:hypothetical protein
VAYVFLFFTFRVITDKCRGSLILNVGKNTYTSACKYDSELPLKIVVHDFWQDSKNKWISDVVTALLKKVKTYLIIVILYHAHVHLYVLIVIQKNLSKKETLEYDKQDQQGTAAFYERNPHMTQQQEPMARSPGLARQH